MSDPAASAPSPGPPVQLSEHVGRDMSLDNSGLPPPGSMEDESGLGNGPADRRDPPTHPQSLTGKALREKQVKVLMNPLVLVFCLSLSSWAPVFLPWRRVMRRHMSRLPHCSIWRRTRKSSYACYRLCLLLPVSGPLPRP